MRIILLLVFLTVGTFAHADESSVCANYDATKHYEYGSEITITGTLRPNEMLVGIDNVPLEFQLISMVLVTAEPVFVQGGEINNPIACSGTEFTLHLSLDQLVEFQQLLKDGKEISVTGKVGMAESSIEEYDNAILRNIQKVSPLNL
ncbi:MAG: hypothetical protein IT287_08825 [Bdellovibrionaceae bacterium]|nr:hypothetical protein [Pseudobdellovibrionaceae bacterium]